MFYDLHTMLRTVSNTCSNGLGAIVCKSRATHRALTIRDCFTISKLCCELSPTRAQMAWAQSSANHVQHIEPLQFEIVLRSSHYAANCLQHVLKWPGRNRLQITCNTSSPYNSRLFYDLHTMLRTVSNTCAQMAWAQSSANHVQHIEPLQFEIVLRSPYYAANCLQHVLKWPGRNRLQITCNTSSPYNSRLFYDLHTMLRTVSNTYAQMTWAQSSANHVQHIEPLQFEIVLPSPHYAANCLQHICSNGLGAIVCKSRATHRALTIRDCFTISILCCELSPTHMLKWPGRNRLQITCNTSSPYNSRLFYHLHAMLRTVSNTCAQMAWAQSSANHVQHIEPLQFEIALPSPCYAANCLQHMCSNGLGAIVCKSRATRRALTIRDFFSISILCCELSPTHVLKWPGRNRLQITCNTSSPYNSRLFYDLHTMLRTVSNTYAQMAWAQSSANHVQHVEPLSHATCRLPHSMKGQLSYQVSQS